MTAKLPIGIMISGRGSNMEALISASSKADYPAEVVVVVSNNPDALGLTYARSHGIAAHAVDHRLYGKDRLSHERAMDAILRPT